MAVSETHLTSGEVPVTEASSASQTALVRVALGLSFLLFLFLAQRLFVYAPDDAFITYRYARNLAEGWGPVFNAGAGVADRTEGYSCPLFMLLMAFALKLPLGLDILLRAKFFGLLCGLATLVVAQTLARRLGLPIWAQAIAPLLIAAHPSFVVGSLDGMETSLQTLLVTAGALCFVREGQARAEKDAASPQDEEDAASPQDEEDAASPQDEEDAAWPQDAAKYGKVESVWFRHGSALLFALCALNRPEGLVLGLIALCARLASRRGRFGREVIVWTTVFLAPVAAWFLFRYAYYGAWLPNTFYAKQAPLETALLKGGAYLGRTFFQFLNDNVVFIGLAAFWWATVVGGVVSDRARRLPNVIVPLLCGGQIVFALRAGGDWMGGWRYLAAILPLLLTLTLVGLADLEEGVRRVSKGAGLAMGAVGAVLAVIGAACVLGHGDFARDREGGYRSWASKGFSRDQRFLMRGWLLDRAVVIGDWLNQNLPANAVVAYSEMGVTPYLSPRLRFLDVDGLTDRGVARLPGARHEQIGVRDDYVTLNGVVGPYLVQERKPDYILRGTSLPVGQSVPPVSILEGAYVFQTAFPMPASEPKKQGWMVVWRVADK